MKRFTTPSRAGREGARDLCDRYAVMDRGQIVLSGTRADMDEALVRQKLAV